MAMEQFENWKGNNCIKHCNLCGIGVCGSCNGIGTKGDAWKAALEWVRGLPLQKYGPIKPKDLIKCIEKELGVESYE